MDGFTHIRYLHWNVALVSCVMHIMSSTHHRSIKLAVVRPHKIQSNVFTLILRLTISYICTNHHHSIGFIHHRVNKSASQCKLNTTSRHRNNAMWTRHSCCVWNFRSVDKSERDKFTLKIECLSQTMHLLWQCLMLNLLLFLTNLQSAMCRSRMRV